MVNAWYNPNHEKHREWKENFGFTDSDLISDNTDESEQQIKINQIRKKIAKLNNHLEEIN